MRDDGRYWLFSAALGSRQFTASATGYQPASAGRVATLDLTLGTRVR